MTSVSQAVEIRRSIRAFKPDPVSGVVVRDILDRAARAPSGGNLQPWRVYALAGASLETFKGLAAARLAAGMEPPEYAVYPENLWEPFRTRRFQAGSGTSPLPSGSMSMPVRSPRPSRCAHFERLSIPIVSPRW